MEVGAFANCKNITQLRIPKGITKLEQSVFSGCSGLQKVVILSGVLSVSRYAFTGCPGLETVECSDPERFDDAFLDTPYWKNRHPDTPLPARLPLDLVGNRSGKMLIQRGYPFFDSQRNYHIRMPGEDGIVEVSSWCSEDGPDSDGFGREEYYDWWLLDESLNPIPGIPMWHEYSNLDMRNHEKQWKALREQAAQIIRMREKR